MAIEERSFHAAVQISDRVIFRGGAYHCHSGLRGATDTSILSTGRWHRGTSRFPQVEAWPALYSSLQGETSVAEISRYIKPGKIRGFRNYQFSKLDIGLSAVLDLRDPSRFDLSPGDLTKRGYSTTHALAEAAIACGFEAIMAPSATLLGDNLIIFPRMMRPESKLMIVWTRPMRLRP